MAMVKESRAAGRRPTTPSLRTESPTSTSKPENYLRNDADFTSRAPRPYTNAGIRVKMSMKVREAIRMVEADGWRLVHQVGSHRQYKHPIKSGRVTVAGNPGDDVKPGTLASIKRQAGLK